jgi:hypothetical protein
LLVAKYSAFMENINHTAVLHERPKHTYRQSKMYSSFP